MLVVSHIAAAALTLLGDRAGVALLAPSFAVAGTDGDSAIVAVEDASRMSAGTSSSQSLAMSERRYSETAASPDAGPDCSVTDMNKSPSIAQRLTSQLTL